MIMTTDCTFREYDKFVDNRKNDAVLRLLESLGLDRDGGQQSTDNGTQK